MVIEPEIGLKHFHPKLHAEDLVADLENGKVRLHGDHIVARRM